MNECYSPWVVLYAFHKLFTDCPHKGSRLFLKSICTVWPWEWFSQRKVRSFRKGKSKSLIHKNANRPKNKRIFETESTGFTKNSYENVYAYLESWLFVRGCELPSTRVPCCRSTTRFSSRWRHPTLTTLDSLP
jgi:hypothetical protein